MQAAARKLRVELNVMEINAADQVEHAVRETKQLCVNLKTAKVLGITVPQTVMVLADRIIQ
jgi:hypothetical protein